MTDPVPPQAAKADDHSDCREVGGCSPECPWSPYPARTKVIADVIVAQRQHLWDVDFCEVQALAQAIADALEAAAPHLTGGQDAARAELLPAENMTLTIARGQLERGENPPVNTTAVLVMALDRLTGREDWTDPSPGPKCCDLHGRNCEPGELCCSECTEADHPAHARLGPCCAPVLSPNTLDEARRIAVAQDAARAEERERCIQLAEQEADSITDDQALSWFHDTVLRQFAAKLREGQP